MIPPEMSSAFVGSVGGSLVTLALGAVAVDRRLVRFTERFTVELRALTGTVKDALGRLERLERLHMRERE